MTEDKKSTINSIHILKRAGGDFLRAPARLFYLSITGMVYAFFLMWIPIIGVFIFYNAFGVIQRLAPKLVRQTWGQIWEDGYLSTICNFSIGGKWLLQILIVGLALGVPGWIAMILAADSDGYLPAGAELSTVELVVIALILSIVFFVHTRLAFLPASHRKKGAVQFVWSATKGHFFALAPITLVKWILSIGPLVAVILTFGVAAISESFNPLELGILLLVLGILAIVALIASWPFFGLLNFRINEVLDPSERDFCKYTEQRVLVEGEDNEPVECSISLLPGLLMAGEVLPEDKVRLVPQERKPWIDEKKIHVIGTDLAKKYREIHKVINWEGAHIKAGASIGPRLLPILFLLGCASVVIVRGLDGGYWVDPLNIPAGGGVALGLLVIFSILGGIWGWCVALKNRAKAPHLPDQPVQLTALPIAVVLILVLLGSIAGIIYALIIFAQT